jgi:hypothetical protein
VETLDPHNTGKIDFNQFVKGMSKLMSDQSVFNATSNTSNDNTNFDEFDSLSRPNGGLTASQTNAVSRLKKKSKVKPIIIQNSYLINKSPHSFSNDTFNSYDTDHSQYYNNNSGSTRVNDDDAFDAATFDVPTTGGGGNNNGGALSPFDELATITGELISLNDFETSSKNPFVPVVSSSSSKNPFLTDFQVEQAGKMHEELENESDPFGFDLNIINNHRKSLATTGSLFSANEVNLMGSGSPLGSPVKK